MTTRAKKEEVVPQAQSLNIYQKLHLAKHSNWENYCASRGASFGKIT